MIDFTALKRNKQAAKILSGRSFHACLIEGPDGENRKALVLLTAMKMLCPEQNAPCGQCRNCKKFLAESHPDLVLIDGGVSVEEMRNALSGILLLPNEAPVRVYLIENAEAMSELVQNVLLKPIEEPPPFAAFILVARHADALLETVRSRCCILTAEDETAQAVPETVPLFLDSIRAGIFSEAESYLDFPGREEQRVFFRACLQEVRRRLLNAAENKRQEDFTYYGGLEEIFAETAVACEYNINIKLRNTVLLARCFQKRRKPETPLFPGGKAKTNQG